MNFNYPQIAAAVYQACTTYDQYLPQLSEDVARAWAKVFQRYGLTVEYLIRGVDAVYATRGNGYRPLPADIAEAARSIRQSEAMKESEEKRTARQEALAAKAAEDVDDLAARKGLPAPDSRKFVRRPQPAEMRVKCPWCKAGPGKRCVVPRTDSQLKGFHPSRSDLVREAS